MLRIFMAFMMFLAMAGPAYADWFFRGTPNNWDKTALTQIGSTNTFESCQTFSGNPSPRFKIDRFGDWKESYPVGDQTLADGSYRIVFNATTHQITFTADQNCGGTQPIDSWYFRGTPNDWGKTAMNRVGTTDVYETCQTFADKPNPRFKIDHLGDWKENYPATDQLMANGSYLVTFNASTHQVGFAADPKCGGVVDNWYFRGTPNKWVATPLTNTDGGDVYTVQVAFAKEDPSPRFKIDHRGDWKENYPTQDAVVPDCANYEISFNRSSKAINVKKLNDIKTGACSGPNLAINATPPSGSYASPQSISLAVLNAGDAKLDIYYTKDGSEPTKASTHYTGEAIPANKPGLNLGVLAVATDAREVKDRFNYQIGELPKTGDFREETIYFLLTTRFYNGDPSNDYHNRDRFKDGDPQWRGDFKGLIAQLDYIKDLGFTAIWITPPVENRSGLDYHGYHAYDWNRVDPRLESPDASYQDLINAAHAKCLKIVQDVVINHSSQYGIRGQVWIDHLPIKYYVPQGSQTCKIDNGPYKCNLGDYKSPFREDNDNPVAPAWFKDRQTTDANGLVPLPDPITCGPSAPASSCQSVPKPGYNPNRFFGIDAQKLDPQWYHLDGFMSGGDWENPTALQRKHMAGDTIDLATENQNVKDYLNNAIYKYLDMGVDAIRLDTAKHLERGNLLEYVNAWKAHKPGLFVFGEVLVKGTGMGDLGGDNGPSQIRPWWYTRLGNDPSNPNSGGDSGFSVLDFPLFSTFRDNVSHGSYGGIGGMLGSDWIYGDATKLVTFLQNHDVGPDNDFKFRYNGDTGMAAATYNMLWTIRGIPALYYGEEIEFMKGKPQDIDGPNMTIDQTGRAYFGDNLEPAAIGKTKSHPLFGHIQRLNLIRRNVPALQKAPMSQVNEFGGGMSFVRDYNNGESYAVVGLAIGGGQNFTVGNVRNGNYVDAVTGNSVSVGNGTLSFPVKGNSAGIYVLNGRGKIGNDGVFLR